MTTGTPQIDQWAHDHIAASQTCPVCFGPVIKHATRENNGVMLATYVCSTSHCWGVHWGLAQVTA